MTVESANNIQSAASIPMPGLLSDDMGSAADRDPATSHEHAPIEDRPERDPSGVGVDEPVTQYARQLWTELDGVARYLQEQVAHGGGGPVVADSSSLLTTDEQWQAWQAIYAKVLSVLAGPKGDQGYGSQQAQLEYQNRRR
jgi:hypothetical protein